MLEARAQEAQSKADGAARVEHDLKSKLAQQQEIADALENEAKNLRERYQQMRLELEKRVRRGLTYDSCIGTSSTFHCFHVRGGHVLKDGYCSSQFHAPCCGD